MDLLLIRHAEPIRVENVTGPADPPLHERGRQQARQLADWLASEHLDEIWSSPMRRAQETALALAATTGLPVHTGDGLAEWDRDSPVYIPVEELKATGDERWQALVSGETFAQSVDPVEFAAGVVEAIEAIVAANRGRRVAVVCHGGVINLYLGWVLGIARHHFFLPAYTSVSRVAAASSGARSVVSLNESGHLRSR